MLVRYTGWGSLSQAFTENHPDWGWVGAELRRMFEPADYAKAEASTPNAHYTSEPVIRGVYRILGRLGFTGGSVLEPALGVGHFIGLVPDGWARATRWTGIELDPTTALPARPSASVRASPPRRSQPPGAERAFGFVGSMRARFTVFTATPISAAISPKVIAVTRLAYEGTEFGAWLERIPEAGAASIPFKVLEQAMEWMVGLSEASGGVRRPKSGRPRFRDSGAPAESNWFVGSSVPFLQNGTKRDRSAPSPCRSPVGQLVIMAVLCGFRGHRLR